MICFHQWGDSCLLQFSFFTRLCEFDFVYGWLILTIRVSVKIQTLSFGLDKSFFFWGVLLSNQYDIAMHYYQQCDTVLCHALHWVILAIKLVVAYRGGCWWYTGQVGACCRAPRRRDVGCPMLYDGDVPSEIREFHAKRGNLVVGI